MARGVGGQAIFGSTADYLLFLGILEDVARKAGAHVHCHSLMVNHFHLLIEVGDVPISDIMRRLLTRYAKCFNLARDRKGHLFQGRFKSKLVLKEAYYIQLLRYINNNAVEAGLAATPADWPWCSHRQFLGPVHSTLVAVDRVLARLGETRAGALRRYRAIMAESSPIAEPEFDVEREAPKPPPAKRSTPSLAALADEVLSESGINVEALGGGKRDRRVTNARRVFVRRAAALGYGTTKIALFLGLSPSTVCGLSHALDA